MQKPSRHIRLHGLYQGRHLLRVQREERMPLNAGFGFEALDQIGLVADKAAGGDADVEREEE